MYLQRRTFVPQTLAVRTQFVQRRRSVTNAPASLVVAEILVLDVCARAMMPALMSSVESMQSARWTFKPDRDCVSAPRTSHLVIPSGNVSHHFSMPMSLSSPTWTSSNYLLCNFHSQVNLNDSMTVAQLVAELVLNVLLKVVSSSVNVYQEQVVIPMCLVYKVSTLFHTTCTIILHQNHYQSHAKLRRENMSLLHVL